MEYIPVQLVEVGTHQNASDLLALGFGMGNYTSNFLSSMANPTRPNPSRISPSCLPSRLVRSFHFAMTTPGSPTLSEKDSKN